MSKQKRKSKKSADGSITETITETITDSTGAPPVVATSSGVEASANPPAVEAAKSKRPRKKKSERTSEMPPTAREGRDSGLKVAPAELDKKLDALEQKLEEKIDAHQAARKGMATDPDDSSIPPVVEHEHEEQFFADAENKPVTSGMSGGFDVIDPKRAHKMTAAAQARRAHLTKYVQGAVAVGLVICAVAFIRMKLPPADRDGVHAASNAFTTEVVVPAVKTPEPVKQPDPTAVVQQVLEGAPITGNIQDTTAADAKATELEAKDAASSSPIGVTDNTVKPKTAWQEKATAKAALESGNNGTAIAAGERSVALDPSDGETWLVLGAAYQASGSVTQAKRCFNACISQGKKGPIDECKSMLASM